MAINTKRPMSPGWWLDRAFTKRAAKMPRLQELHDWHEGIPPVPSAVSAAREAFREFESESTTNFAELIVGSLRERLAVREIRTQVSGALADDVAWTYWRDNNLDVEMASCIETFLWAGDAFGIVGTDPVTAEPVITPEDPRDVVTFHDPIRQSRVRAGVKFLRDTEMGRDYAYLTVAAYVLQEPRARRWVIWRDLSDDAVGAFAPDDWKWDADQGGSDGEQLEHELVPIVRLRNRGGKGEYEPHLSVLKRINRFTFQLSVIIMYQAYKQRAILADVEDPDDQAQGDLKNALSVDSLDDVLTSDPGAWFLLPSGAKVWESTQTDVNGLLKAINDDVMRLAAVARRPMAIFAPDNQSASGADFTREGLTFAVEDKQTRITQFVVDLFHLVFKLANDESRAVKSKILVGWMPAERYSITSKASATAQVGTKFPLRTILREIWQKSPDEITQIEAEQADEALLMAEFDPATGEQPRMTIDEISKAAEALGRLQRAAVTNEAAADVVGLDGLAFNDGRSTSLKFPDE